MKAINLTATGPHADFQPTHVPMPRRGENEVLIKLEAIGVNPLDQAVRLGHFPTSMPTPFVPGSEGAGTVVEGADSHRPGDRVFVLGGGYGVSAPGTYAEYISVNRNWVVPMPPGMSFEEAAAFGVAALTAWLVLHRVAALRAGETVLILGASGGVGMMATQLARRAGARVIASVGGPEKSSLARELGADQVVITDDSLGAQLEDLAAGLHVIVDLVGGTYLAEALPATKPGARVVMVGYSAGPTTTINVIHALTNEITLRGFNLFAADPADVRAAMADVLAAYAKRELRVIVARVFPLAQAEEAMRYRLSRSAFGRVVLAP